MVNIKVFKYVIISVVMLVNLYPVAELTRCIIKYNQWITLNQTMNNYCEIGLMWLLWILTFFILNYFLNKIIKVHLVKK